MKKIFAILKSYCYNPLIQGESAAEWSMVYVENGEAKIRPLTGKDARDKIHSNNMGRVKSNKFGEVYELPDISFANCVKENGISTEQLLRY